MRGSGINSLENRYYESLVYITRRILEDDGEFFAYQRGNVKTHYSVPWHCDVSHKASAGVCVNLDRYRDHGRRVAYIL